MPVIAPLRADALPVPFLKVADGRIRYANPAAAAIGFREGLSLDEAAPDLAEAVRFSSENQRSVRIPETVCRLDGKDRTISAAVEILPHSEYGVFLTDMTATTELTDELAQSVIDAEVANRRLNRNVTTLSLLARLGSELARATTAAETRSHLERALRATGAFALVDLAIDETSLDQIPLDAPARSAAHRLLSGDQVDTLPEIPMLVPVRGRDRIHAIIVAIPQPSDEDAPLPDLQPFASLAAFTLDNILLYRDLIESLQDLAFRNRVARELQQALSPQEIEQRLADLLPAYLPISWFGLITAQEERDYPAHLAEPVRAGLRGHLAVHDALDGGWICVPVRLSGPLTRADRDVYGVFAACSPRRGAFVGRGKELFLALADLAAVPLRNVRMYNDLRAHNVAVQYLNEELARTIRELKAANEMKTRFVSIVSHEFRTPLTSISCYVDTLINELGKLEAATVAQFLGVVREEAERLTRLINQLLDLSRLHARDRPLARDPVDVQEIARAVANALQPVAERKGLAIRLGLPADPVICAGDADGIYQVILNIAGNAIRYTRAGEITIAVAGESDFVYIRISDTGIGIPVDALDAIFSEFFTVSQTRATIAAEETDRLAGERSGGSGTGLGLSIARAIVEQHGGVIQVQSRVGAGSTFTVMLPRQGAEK